MAQWNSSVSNVYFSKPKILFEKWGNRYNYCFGIIIFILSMINSKYPMVYSALSSSRPNSPLNTKCTSLLLAENCLLTCLHAIEYEAFLRWEKSWCCLCQHGVDCTLWETETLFLLGSHTWFTLGETNMCSKHMNRAIENRWNLFISKSKSILYYSRSLMRPHF